jgi:probable F420-dependent oxidoreductase
MHIGLFVVATENSMPIVDLAPAAEQLGFESLWFPEHSHIPLDSAYPGGIPIPEEYAHTLDPFICLATAASVTNTIRLGTGICLVIERDTILTAKEVATIDLVSNGRFEFGIGGGWNQREMAHHGTEYKTRFDKLEDQITAMKVIWSEAVAEHHGPFVDFNPSWSWPKPVQSPHPPILLGGESIHTLRRVVAYCDGWLPRARDPENVFNGMLQLKELADKAGRDIPVSVFGVAPKIDLINQFKAAGAKRCIILLPAENESKTLERLDRYANLISYETLSNQQE